MSHSCYNSAQSQTLVSSFSIYWIEMSVTSLLFPFLHTKQVGMFVKVFFVFWQRRIKYYEHGQFKLYLFLLENQLTWLKVINWLHNSSLKHFLQLHLHLSEVPFDKTYNKSQWAISGKSYSSSLKSQSHPLLLQIWLRSAIALDGV